MLVTSFFPGRIRMRSPVFKDAEICALAEAILRQSTAIQSLEHNSTTGSILVVYDTQKVPFDKLQPLLPFLEALQKEARFYSTKNRSVILAMLKELDGIVKSWAE